MMITTIRRWRIYLLRTLLCRRDVREHTVGGIVFYDFFSRAGLENVLRTTAAERCTCVHRQSRVVKVRTARFGERILFKTQ